MDKDAELALFDLFFVWTDSMRLSKLLGTPVSLDYVTEPREREVAGRTVKSETIVLTAYDGNKTIDGLDLFDKIKIGLDPCKWPGEVEVDGLPNVPDEEEYEEEKYEEEDEEHEDEDPDE